MNPGYAGRSELPENLKALLRPMSMMKPDISLIIEIMLFSEGFQTSKMLSKKMTTLYYLMEQQLSKQDHYDFGLRSVKSVLNSAGALKRGDDRARRRGRHPAPRDPRHEPAQVHRAGHAALQRAHVRPLPGRRAARRRLRQAAARHRGRAAEAAGLQLVPAIIRKCIQCYESKLTRHGNMLVGRRSAARRRRGRSSSRPCRASSKRGRRAERRLALPGRAPDRDQPEGGAVGQPVRRVRPADLRVDRRRARQGDARGLHADEKPDEKWLLLDGPVDTLWIESMNTVLDDNKLLTLINGERIAMPPQVSLLFEVEDLSVASPATVSRAGMVYVDATEMGWQPYVESWLAQAAGARAREKLRGARRALRCPSCSPIRESSCKSRCPWPSWASCARSAACTTRFATKANGVSRPRGEGARA